MSRSRAKDVFLQIIELPLEQRAVYVKTMCSDDPVLHDDVQRLLAAHDQAEAFLATGPAPGPAPGPTPGPGPGEGDGPPTAEITEAPGMTIGRYKLLQRIGEGGFGVVYMAEQREPVKRIVALKVIKLGMDTRQVIARFEAERQALAMMDHPNIARVLDAGATEAGRPYFVMELVKGIPITHYCEGQHLDLETRLKLFCDVCRAVQHAHQKGVIHRDLKPSNVMVTLHDGVPVVKVIDFGIAKATNARLTERTLFTGFGQFIGTPEYMSPEQAELSGLDVDTRSDVYSLGVLLYELLTSMLPFDSQALRAAGYDEIRRIIREDEPPTPSSRLSSLATQQRTMTTAQSDASSAGTSQTGLRRPDLDALVRRVRGDLDWIVMKCLEKDRTRRYETARDLAQDVERHVAGEPVEAAPPSRMYRLGKLARRHRGRVITASVIMLLLLAGITGTSAFAFRAEQRRAEAVEAREAESAARREAQEAQAEAQQRAEELEQVAAFQQSQLAELDPSAMGALLRRDVIAGRRTALERASVSEQAMDEKLQTLNGSLEGVNFTNIAMNAIEQEILGRALQAIDDQFADSPLIRARLLQAIADTARMLGLLDLAHGPQSEAVEVRQRLLGDEHPDTILSMSNLGWLLMARGRFSDAEPYYRDSLEKRRRLFGELHPDTLASVSNIGFLLKQQGNYAQAERFFREALEGFRQLYDDEHPSTLSLLNNMGLLLRQQGRYAEAESFFREALAGRRRVLGADHPHTLDSVNNLGLVLEEQGNYSGAEPYYREALMVLRRVRGDAHPSTLNLLNNMGRLLREQGKYAEAETAFNEAIKTLRRVLGNEHPRTLVAINNMGLLYFAQRRLEDAEPYFREALATRRRVLGVEHAETLNSLNNMGLLLSDFGRLAEAEPYLREALEFRRRVSGDEHPVTLNVMNNLGTLLRRQGKYTEADRLGIEAVESSQRVLSDNNWRVAFYLGSHARTLLAMGRFNEAETQMLEAHSRMKALRGEAHPRAINLVHALVELYEAWHNVEPNAGHDDSAAQWRARLPGAQEIKDDAAAAQP